MIQNDITQYIAELNRIYKAGNATEHTYRPALKSLLEKMTNGLTVTNEPKRIACGAPDYIVTRKEIPVGYIEAKDIGRDLNSKENKVQFDRYKQSLDNLIITDYLTFQLFEDGESVTSVTLAKTGKTGIEADKTQFEAFAALINRFTGYEGQGIQTSVQLSKEMATKARLMANIIEKALDEDAADSRDVTRNVSTISGQLKGFREVLIHDITHKEFADIYAQTIAYGMFAAKLNDETNDTFTRSKAAQLIPHTNPFLRKLFQYIAGYDLDERICWVVDDLADLFNYVDINEILKEFNKDDHDPIIHFYETFLAEYDPALRKSRGVWYTPKPVVQFIVQAVDDILKQDFGLSQGLADMSKMKLKQPVKQSNGSIKEEEKEYHRVQILDPATGTGTFLAEVAQNIYRRFKNQQGIWQSYADEHLIPRINGFEILMASYAMAHLKLDMLLQQTGYKHSGNERLRIYLTNSLEEARAITEIPFAQWLSEEANEANRIKQDVPVMVVLGNPPYSGISQNNGKWISDLIEDYKYVDGVHFNERKHWLQDDYVKFIRFGQYFVNKNNEGILAYINNHSFIDNPTFRGMRWNLMKSFDKMYIIDLHGNSKKKEVCPDGSKDENVFDIQQGVSINIFVKTGFKAKNTLAEVYHFDLYGKRQKKYDYLQNNKLSTVPFVRVEPTAPFYFLMPKNEEGRDKYEQGFSVNDLMTVNSVGCMSGNDVLNISFSASEQNVKINDLLTMDKSSWCENYKHTKDTSNWSYSPAKYDAERSIGKILNILYRPFDIRYTFYSGKSGGLWSRPLTKVMRHFLSGDNLGLVIGRQGQVVGNMLWNLIFVSENITDLNLYYRGGGMVFPLYLYPETNKLFSDETRKPNLNKAIIKEISRQIGLQFTEEKEKIENTFAPVDVLDYIYAVLHSPTYRERYKEFLKIDFPRVPYPENAEQFRSLAALGGKLRRLHLMKGVEPQEGIANFPIAGSNEIEKLQYVDNKVSINETQYFEHVPPEAWNFYIGGYQPAQKWLKDRKGRTLNFEDIWHYQKIIRVLKETGEVMREIDNKCNLN